MANKKLSESGTSVDIHIDIEQSVNEKLENMRRITGKSRAKLIREAISNYVGDGHEPERAKLKEDIFQGELQLSANKARLAMLEAKDQLKQAAGKKREEFIERIVNSLKGELKHGYKGEWVITAELGKYVQSNVIAVNRVLNGSGEPIKEQEVIDRIIQVRTMEEEAIL